MRAHHIFTIGILSLACASCVAEPISSPANQVNSLSQMSVVSSSADSSSSIVAMESTAELFSLITSHTSDASWTAPQPTSYKDMLWISVEADLVIPEGTLTGQSISHAGVDPLNDARNDLDSQFERNGWERSFEADGATGSIWGYKKKDGSITRIVMLATKQDCTFNEDQENIDCVNPRSTVFISELFNMNDKTQAFTEYQVNHPIE